MSLAQGGWAPTLFTVMTRRNTPLWGLIIPGLISLGLSLTNAVRSI